MADYCIPSKCNRFNKRKNCCSMLYPEECPFKGVPLDKIHILAQPEDPEYFKRWANGRR